jgi:hypothetical protein
MAAPTARSGKALAVSLDADPGLVALGLAAGQRVRFRPRAGARWIEAAAVRRERDGSVGLRDERGRTRAIAIDRIEVATIGPRGGRIWEALADRAERPEQLAMPVEPPDLAR